MADNNYGFLDLLLSQKHTTTVLNSSVNYVELDLANMVCSQVPFQLLEIPEGLQM